MTVNYGKSLTVLTVLGAALTGTVVSSAQDAAPADPDLLSTEFSLWIEALEDSATAHPAWAFPFAAPRPDELDVEELEIILALRRLSRNGRTAELQVLTDKIERRHGPLPVQMRFWLAYAQYRLQRHRASLANLRILLAATEGWKHLEAGQQAWVLTSTPDLLFRLQERETAALLYERLADSSSTQLNIWGQYQLAGMDFLARDFQHASARYSAVCAADKPRTWRDHACAMARISERLSGLDGKGERHDEVASTTP